MAVSEQERDYMRRIGRAKEASHEEAAARHRSLPVAERLRRSWMLYLASRDSARDGTREDDPARFYDRARKLGLYRP